MTVWIAFDEPKILNANSAGDRKAVTLRTLPLVATERRRGRGGEAAQASRRLVGSC
jgi:hypothetical protein